MESDIQGNFLSQSIKVIHKMVYSAMIWYYAEKQNIYPCSESHFFKEIYGQKDFEEFLSDLPGYDEVTLSQEYLGILKRAFDFILFPEDEFSCTKCWEKSGDLLKYYIKSDCYASPRGTDGYVYFLRNGFDWKIGATTQHDPWLRIKDHTKYYPELKVEHIIICEEPFEVEKWFHSYFDDQDQRVHGRYELFRFDELTWYNATQSFRKSDRYKKSYDAKRLLWMHIHGTKKVICDLH